MEKTDAEKNWLKDKEKMNLPGLLKGPDRDTVENMKTDGEEYPV